MGEKTNFFNEIDKNELKEYFKNTNFDNDDIILLSLYVNYEKITRLKEKKVDLKVLEDEIYSVNDKKINGLGKINIEIVRIKNSLKKNKKYADYVEKKLRYIESIKNKAMDKSIEFYIKKEIVRLDALLGLNITFFEAAQEAFLEENRNFKLSYKNENLPILKSKKI